MAPRMGALAMPSLGQVGQEGQRVVVWCKYGDGLGRYIVGWGGVSFKQGGPALVGISTIVTFTTLM